MGEDLDNRMSAFRMRSPLGMKGIYDFIALPSIFPDTYFETLLFPTVTGGIRAHSFLFTFCTVISLRTCAETESRGGGLPGGYGEVLGLETWQLRSLRLLRICLWKAHC